MRLPAHWQRGLPWIVAHRGGAGEGGMENTLPTFRRAIDAGADMLECDVQVTRDGELVLSHDVHLRRTMGLNQRIATMDYDELPVLHPVLGWRPAPNDRSIGRQGTPFPRLADFLALNGPPLHLSVEWKPKRGQGMEHLIEAVRCHPRRECIILGSEWQRPISTARRLWPDLITYATQWEVVLFLLSHHLRWRGRNPPFQALALPVTYRSYPLVTQKLVQFARKCGLLVHVWTVNDPGQMRELLTLGVDALITDFPKMALGVRTSFLDR